MDVAMLISPPEGQPHHAVVCSVASRLLNGLRGPAAQVVRKPVELAPGSLQRAELDLLTIVTSVGHGPVSTDLLDALAATDSLVGCVAFLAAVGPWPAEVGTADRAVAALGRYAKGPVAAA
jgi:hypothetical protein